MTEDIGLKIIRTTIFSIVVPHKEPCSTYKIKMEYKDMEGEDIPFSDYGFRTLDEFLLGHPMLNGMMQDGKWVFAAKLSERSANIQALVKGQKGKKKKGKKGNPFARTFTRSSYHGKPTLGQGDVRRANGSQPFNRNTTTYRSFTPGAHRPPFQAPINSNLSNSRTSDWGSQKLGNGRPDSSFGWASSSSSSSSFAPSSRPPPPWNQKKFTPILAPTRSLNMGAPPVRPDGPVEGMRRFNIILSKCKGVATLRVFCRLYAQEFNVAFVGEELRRHFNTVDLTEVINKFGNDKILVSPTPDGSVMFTDKGVLEAHTRAARDLEEKKKNSVVIEPEKKHCAIPSLKVMYDELTEMLVDLYPSGIPLAEITSQYKTRAGVEVDPLKVFALPWNELIEKKFNSRVRIDNGKAVLTPTYIKANNLHVRPTGERKKQELVTLSDLGIVFLEESSQEDDEDEEESETESCISEDVRNVKTWRATPSGYESMCSSVSSSVQCLDAERSPEMNDTVVSEEVDELTERMRTVKVKVDHDSPRAITITRDSSRNNESMARRNLMSTLSGIKEDVVAKNEEEKPIKTSTETFFTKLRSAFRYPPRGEMVKPVPSLASNPTPPNVLMIPKGELKFKAQCDYKSFSVSTDSSEVYAFKVTCKSAHFRILGNPCFTCVGAPKLLQVLAEDAPKGATAVTIDFVKKREGEKRNASELMRTCTPEFTVDYAFKAE